MAGENINIMFRTLNFYQYQNKAAGRKTFSGKING